MQEKHPQLSDLLCPRVTNLANLIAVVQEAQWKSLPNARLDELEADVS